jgi:hypothetical protein
MTVTSVALAPVKAARRRIDGGFSIDASGYDQELARWACRLGQVGWSTVVHGAADLADGPMIVVVNRSLLGAETLTCAVALADERSEGVRCAELVDVPLIDSWQRRIGFVSPSDAEVSVALRSGVSVVIEVRHLACAVNASIAQRVPLVPAAVMSSVVRRRRTVRLGAAQLTNSSGPLAAARLRDAVTAELERTSLAARATWRLT